MKTINKIESKGNNNKDDNINKLIIHAFTVAVYQIV
jgi:hypothetical protein